jgi:hemerythrin-like domain-containing protein
LAGEEKLFYPVLEQKGELRNFVNHAYEEHNQIKSISFELESMDSGNQNWTSKVKELNETVNHHIQEEKNTVFSAAQKVPSREKAQDIARQYLDFSQNI